MSTPRYQVFVSSTYLDLKDERLGVTEQLLQLRAIPAGMELFSASGQPPWRLIERALEDTDYMVLILAGRYGSSLDGDPRSYTEREYDYAVEHGIPVLPFLHHKVGSIASDFVDTGVQGKRREAFWAKVRDSGRHTVAYWTDASDLSRRVMTAVTSAFHDDPRTGWVRADAVPPPSIPPPSRPAATSNAAGQERQIDTLVRAVTKLPFLAHGANFQLPVGTELQPEHARRLSQIETSALPLVRAVATAARWDTEGQLNSYWVQLVRELSTAPNVGGLTALINLTKAPAAIVLAAIGLGACAGRRDDLVGLILSPQVDVDDPYTNREIPAVAGLGPTLLYAEGWADKDMGNYFRSSLDGEDWGDRTFMNAWQKWQYLTGLARNYYATTLQTSRGGLPCLLVEDRPQLGLRPVVARQIRKEVDGRGDAHPLLTSGFCGGKAELFDTAAETFDSNYGAWAEEQDWAALPSQGHLRGGAMPTGPHYPGEGL